MSEKMKLGDMPAMPSTIWDVKSIGVVPRGYESGMTLRQHYAGLAMQGLLANASVHQSQISVTALAEEALQYTDALLAELEKSHD